MEPDSISDTYKALTEQSPIHHPDCCASLSVPLVEHIASQLPPDPALTLSIGSGTGLLEALIREKRPALDLRAVEVPTANNKYMPLNRLEIVHGYRDICNLAADASAWIFVYPRDPWLLQKYLRAFGDQKCKLIIWIGPKADELEKDFFGEVWVKEEHGACALKDYETMALWRRRALTMADSNPSVIS